MKPQIAPGYGHLASISWERDAFRTGLISATTGFGTFVLRDLQCLWGKKCERFENTIGNFIFFPVSQANWSASLPVLPVSCWLFPTKACSVLNVQSGRSKSLRTKSLVHSINPLYKAGKKKQEKRNVYFLLNFCKGRLSFPSVTAPLACNLNHFIFCGVVAVWAAVGWWGWFSADGLFLPLPCYCSVEDRNMQCCSALLQPACSIFTQTAEALLLSPRSSRCLSSPFFLTFSLS